MTKADISVSVNGATHVESVEVRRTLADFLREQLHLTGTHLGCEHGVCGACTVLLDGQPVRSCLIFAVQCQERAVTTVEGLSQDQTFHRVQEAFWKHKGFQCGFCTPGFLTLLASAVDSGDDLTDTELTDLLASNLCRCTGYESIRQAAEMALQKNKP